MVDCGPSTWCSGFFLWRGGFRCLASRPSWPRWFLLPAEPCRCPIATSALFKRALRIQIPRSTLQARHPHPKRRLNHLNVVNMSITARFMWLTSRICVSFCPTGDSAKAGQSDKRPSTKLHLALSLESTPPLLSPPLLRASFFSGTISSIPTPSTPAPEAQKVGGIAQGPRS